jgi:hypothetical protein
MQRVVVGDWLVRGASSVVEVLDQFLLEKEGTIPLLEGIGNRLSDTGAKMLRPHLTEGVHPGVRDGNLACLLQLHGGDADRRKIRVRFKKVRRDQIEFCVCEQGWVVRVGQCVCTVAVSTRERGHQMRDQRRSTQHIAERLEYWHTTNTQQ